MLSQLLLRRERMRRDNQAEKSVTSREQHSREVYSPGYGIRGTVRATRASVVAEVWC